MCIYITVRDSLIFKVEEGRIVVSNKLVEILHITTKIETIDPSKELSLYAGADLGGGGGGGRVPPILGQISNFVM